MPGVRVDGNDILAVSQASMEAVDRAAPATAHHDRGVTYRREGHSSTPTIRRCTATRTRRSVWSRRDPLNRLRGYLKHKGLSRGSEKQIIAQYNEAITRRAGPRRRDRDPAGGLAVDDVYEELPWISASSATTLLPSPTKSPHKQ